MLKPTIPSPKLRKSIERYFQRIQNNIKTIDSHQIDWETIIYAQQSHTQYFIPDLISQITHSHDQKNLNQLLQKRKNQLAAFNTQYLDLIQARNNIARQNRYPDYSAFLLHDLKIKITSRQIVSLIRQYLIQTTNRVNSIHTLWEITQSQYQICTLSKLPTINPTTGITLLDPYYPLLSSHTNKINYVSSDKSSTHYNPTTDIFTISLNERECSNHAIIGLLHELSHVGFILAQFQEDRNPWLLGKYVSEISVAKTLFLALPIMSPQLWILYEQEKRLFLVNILFQLLVYSQPTNQPNLLYLEALRLAYPKATFSPETQYFYLFQKNLFSEPLNGLAQAIALVETI
ncbi:MAG: hypothetical protein ABII21_00945 [bacterium]